MLAAVLNSRAAFHREWKHYELSGRRGDAIAGRWCGEWISEQSGHRGELKCVLSPVSPEVYQACFYASFSLVFRVGYMTKLNVNRTNGRILLTGQEDLGPLAGGIYRSEGEVCERDFNCHYSCKYDHGIFRLKRLD